MDLRLKVGQIGLEFFVIFRGACLKRLPAHHLVDYLWIGATEALCSNSVMERAGVRP